MKKCFYFCCWLLVFGCADEKNEVKNPYAGNYEFSFHTYYSDPMGPPKIEVKSENILVVKTNNVADFEIEPNDNKDFSSNYETFESGIKIYIYIEGKFDSLNNLNVRYIRGVVYGGGQQQTHTIIGVKID